MPRSAFIELLQIVNRRFPTQQALARALGIDIGHLNHLLNGKARPFNVTNCLRLAKLANLPPSEVLRAAGKGEFAELLEDVYGPYTSSDLTPTQQHLLRLWDRLPARVGAPLLALLDRIADLRPDGPSPRRPRPR